MQTFPTQQNIYSYVSVRKHQRGNQEWTIRRHWQNRARKTKTNKANKIKTNKRKQTNKQIQTQKIPQKKPTTTTKNKKTTKKNNKNNKKSTKSTKKPNKNTEYLEKMRNKEPNKTLRVNPVVREG